MDFQRDYILRLIHMLGELMRRLAEKLDDRERRRMLDEFCLEQCGMPLATAESLTDESLRALLPPMPRMVLSDLMLGKAEYVALPYGDADALKVKALRLLASLYGETRLCDLCAEKLTRLKRDVLTLLAAPDLMDCARFFATAQRYDEMEDALFQALPLETEAVRECDREEAICLLRVASRANEFTLVQCRMTSHELRESARELETLAPKPHERENPE
jgi:hypothetical protein